MGLEYRFNIPQTYCEKWPVGCQFCDLLLCDGKKETALMRQKCDPCKPTQPECGECEFAKPVTNADKIRQMTDEELAEMMAHGNCGYCKIHDYCFSQKGVDCDEAWLNWLKLEASE